MTERDLERLIRNPAVGLGIAITIGLALGAGRLGDLLPGGPATTPTPPPTPATPIPNDQNPPLDQGD